MYSLSEIIMGLKQMAAERIVARQVGEHVLNHIEEYMRQKHAATIRLHFNSMIHLQTGKD
jgi:hypothetical protein